MPSLSSKSQAPNNKQEPNHKNQILNKDNATSTEPAFREARALSRRRHPGIAIPGLQDCNTTTISGCSQFGICCFAVWSLFGFWCLQFGPFVRLFPTYYLSTNYYFLLLRNGTSLSRRSVPWRTRRSCHWGTWPGSSGRRPGPCPRFSFRRSIVRRRAWHPRRGLPWGSCR